MNTCDTCKWWGKATWMHYSFTDLGMRCCERIVYNASSESIADRQPSVMAIHDNFYGCELFTGPKFGCIHHEAK